MAQDYDNIGKSLWTDHAADLSRFVLEQDDVEVLEDLDTQQQTVIARQTDITKLVRVNNNKAILHVELQLRDSTDTPMWARNAQYQGYLVGEYQMPVYSNDQKTQADLLYGISVFGGIVYNAELLDRLIPEELMLESKTYQRQMEKAARETTLKNTLTVLNRKFPAEAVNALTPEMQNIDDLQRLEQLLIAAAEARNLDTFTQMLHESEPVGKQQTAD